MITIQQKVEYANAILNHPAHEAVKEDILLKLFNEWLKADSNDPVMKDTIRGMNEFYRMLSALSDGAKDLTDKGDSPEDTPDETRD